MPYTPPSGSSVDLEISTAYTAPSGNDVSFAFTDAGAYYPPTADIVVETPLPTLTKVTTKSAPTSDVVALTDAPTFTQVRLVVPPTSEVVVNADTPTWVSLKSISAPTVDATFVADAPSYTVVTTLATPTSDIVVLHDVPTYSVTKALSAPTPDIVVDLPTVAWKIGTTLTPPSADIAVDAPTPSLFYEYNLYTPTADIVAETLAPAWSRHLEFYPSTVDVVADGPLPTFSVITLLSAPTPDIAVEALIPSTLSETTLSAPTADIAVDVTAHAYNITYVFYAPTAEGGLEALAPTLYEYLRIDPPSATATFGIPNHAFYYLQVRAAYSLPYAIVGRLTAAFELLWQDRVFAANSIQYSINTVIQRGVEIDFNIKSRDRVYSPVTIQYAVRISKGVGLSWSIPPVYRVHRAKELRYALRPSVKVGKALPYNLTAPVAKAVSVDYAILPFNPIRKGIKAVWSLTGVPGVPIVDEPYLMLNGQRVAVVSGDVSTSEGGYAWECNMTLARVTDYVQFSRGDIFTVHIYGETWTFEVDGKELNRNAPAAVSCRVMGVSPSAQFTAPRHSQDDYVWDAPITAQTAAEEAAGVVLNWDIVDWTIPAYRLAFTEADPMSVIRKLAEVAGGVVESSLTGDLRIRPLYPVSPADYDTTAVDHSFVESTDIIAVSESYGYNDVFNKFRIMDVQESIQDSMQYIEDYPGAFTGIMRVNPHPWRSGLSLSHTGDGTVVIGLPTVTYRLIEDEIIEVFKGQATASAPIYEVTDVVWEATSLGGIVVSRDSSAFTVVGPAANSVIRLSYRTRSMDYPVSSVSGRPTQFLLNSPPLS